MALNRKQPSVFYELPKQHIEPKSGLAPMTLLESIRTIPNTNTENSNRTVDVRRKRIPPVTRLVTADAPIMLILRGIAGFYGDRYWERGALDEPPALDYAALRGYQGVVIDEPGTTRDDAAQVRKAIAAIKADRTIQGLYGFSGGGYNIRRILRALLVPEQIRLVVVVGAEDGNSPRNYAGPWELVWKGDPPQGHMAGPRVLLEEARHG
jgi:hypothetical protein